jgi:Putative prokaryotic signal transducing protein
MEQENAVLTVFRSAENSAEEECSDIRAFLEENGIVATIATDDVPGVVEGSYEVRVAENDADRALELIARPPVEAEPADPSHDLDPVSIYRSESTPIAEMEAMGLKAILESNDIPAIVMGGAMMPNLPVEVRVAEEDEARARAVIADAAAAGPEAAEEAELSSELQA